MGWPGYLPEQPADIMSLQEFSVGFRETTARGAYFEVIARDEDEAYAIARRQWEKEGASGQHGWEEPLYDEEANVNEVFYYDEEDQIRPRRHD